MTPEQEIGELLAEHVKPEAVEETMARKVPAFGGRSINDAIADGEAPWVLDVLRETFDWGVSA